MTEKAWTLAEEEELTNAHNRLQELKRRKNNSLCIVLDNSRKYIDKTVTSHQLDLSGIADFLVANRWELIDILTEGEYTKLLSFRALALEQQQND